MKKDKMEVLEAWGFLGDWDLACALVAFLESTEARDDKETDRLLRIANLHLDRILGRREESRDMEYISKRNSHMKAVTTNKSISLNWPTYNSQKNVSIKEVVEGYHLTSKEEEFIEAIHYKSLRIGVAVAIIDELIDLLNYDEDNDL